MTTSSAPDASILRRIAFLVILCIGLPLGVGLSLAGFVGLVAFFILGGNWLADVTGSDWSVSPWISILIVGGGAALLLLLSGLRSD